MRTLYRLIQIVILVAGISAVHLGAQPSPASSDFFESKVRPILANSCFGCHTNSALGGLRLDTLEGMTKGGEHGTALKPGDPENSPLISRLKEDSADLRMPKGGKLKPAQIADLEAWV